MKLARKNSRATMSAKRERMAGDFFVPSTARTLEWLGAVNYDNLDKIVTKMKKLLAEDSKKEIGLVVGSYGGQTGAGMNFFDAVRTWLRPNLVTIGSGDVDSSGIIIFLAGKKRYLTKNTTMLLHLGGRNFCDNKRFSTADMEDMLREDKLKDYQYACILSDATRGKFCPDKILEMMSKNTVLTAEEAVRMGLAHKVI